MPVRPILASGGRAAGLVGTAVTRRVQRWLQLWLQLWLGWPVAATAASEAAAGARPRAARGLRCMAGAGVGRVRLLGTH